MMSSACFMISAVESPSRRIAALLIASESVPIATVNTEGTFTRMFSMESAPSRGISICIGSRERYSKSWMSGMTKAPPPCRVFET